MTSARSQVDPAFAAALDAFTVPSASSDFADRIVAATSRSQPALAGGATVRHDRRGPWRRRAVAGGLALLLGTTAVAATLLERAGIYLPNVVAALSPAHRASPPKPSSRRQIAARTEAANVGEPAKVMAENVVPVEPLAPRPLPAAVLVRERLAQIRPAERRVVVRQAIQHAIANRAAERRFAMSATGALPTLAADRIEHAPFAARPAVRAAIAERIGNVQPSPLTHASRPVSMPGPLAALTDARAANGPGPAPLVDTDSSASIAQATRVHAERPRELAELRRMRALRQELRRQRRR